VHSKRAKAATTTVSIADRRLANQRITRPAPPSPEKIVAWFGAVQAQEYGPAKWGLGLRARGGVTDAAVERAIHRGQILRTHLLRPTWHFVSSADIRWMLELTAPQVHRRMSPYDQQLGLDSRVMSRALGVIERAIGISGCLTRKELGTRLERAGLAVNSMKLAHIMMYAELKGLICSGPRVGNHFTYALLTDRAPATNRFSRDEALAELTLRYFRSHGPATLRDFVWWSGLGTPLARRGLEMTQARPEEVDGLTYWTIGRQPKIARPGRTGVHLLPIYDEYLVAYRDQSAVPRPAYLLGGFQNSLVIDGQVAGTWRTVRGHQGVTAKVSPNRRLTPGERRGLAQAVARCQSFYN
jgi:Winged helix DNA-binding domain